MLISVTRRFDGCTHARKPWPFVMHVLLLPHIQRIPPDYLSTLRLSSRSAIRFYMRGSISKISPIGKSKQAVQLLAKVSTFSQLLPVSVFKRFFYSLRFHWPLAFSLQLLLIDYTLQKTHLPPCMYPHCSQSKNIRHDLALRSISVTFGNCQSP